MRTSGISDDINNDQYLTALTAESGIFDQAMTCIGKSALRKICNGRVRSRGKTVSVITLEELEEGTLSMSPGRRFFVTAKDGFVQQFDSAFEAGRDLRLDFEAYAKRILDAVNQQMNEDRTAYSRKERSIISTLHEVLPSLISDATGTDRTVRLDGIVALLELLELIPSAS